MARPGFMSHWKYKLLVRLLGVGRASARGLMELLWEVGHESGNPVIGDSAAVEAAAEWEGEPGRFFDALKECRLIEELADGRWMIHDYWHHAPEYVQGRSQRERERQKGKKCAYCQSTFHSSKEHATFCTNSCRQAAYRSRSKDDGTESLRDVTDGSVTVCNSYGTPSPSPSPSPSLKDKTARAADQEGFAEFWSAYPKRAAKADAVKAWSKLKPDAVLRATILKAIETQKRGRQWSEGFVPNAATWLNGRRWEDEPEVANNGRPHRVGRDPSRVEAADDKYSNVAVKAVGDLEARLGGQTSPPDGRPAEAGQHPAHGVGGNPIDF